MSAIILARKEQKIGQQLTNFWYAQYLENSISEVVGYSEFSKFDIFGKIGQCQTCPSDFQTDL